ncbi:hypothetical protein PGQ11_010264 [Apiospora arundinis]|uniref:Uncharacterized protein n=1 Tax=Apiospora arundinis TaxID=335852 RepID=A0ABR2IAV9_9PEZI
MRCPSDKKDTEVTKSVWPISVHPDGMVSRRRHDALPVWREGRRADNGCMVDDAAEEHGLTLARVALDPEQSLVRVVAPSAEVGVIKHPDVGVYQQAALGILDGRLIVVRVGDTQVGEV